MSQNAQNDSDDDEDLDLGNVFPEERREATPPPAVVEYTRRNGEKLSIQLVNSHPLWGHVLYPTAICMGDFLSDYASTYVKNKRVLELGAGGGLPSLVAALEGARKTVVTDFPDASLLSNLQRNVDMNIPEELRALISVEGYTWGSRVTDLLALVETPSPPAYDTILAADLVFNHSQHLALLQTCELCLADSPSPVLLCFYAHHRPTTELIAKDEGFVKLAQERGWIVERVLRNEKAGPAFPEDTHYDLAIRSTVHGFKLVPPSSSRR